MVVHEYFYSDGLLMVFHGTLVIVRKKRKSAQFVYQIERALALLHVQQRQ